MGQIISFSFGLWRLKSSGTYVCTVETLPCMKYPKVTASNQGAGGTTSSWSPGHVFGNRIIDWHRGPSNLQSAFTCNISELHNDLRGKSVRVLIFFC